MNATPPTSGRLDSWKAIADYLDRDLATVRRWEKSMGLPVHRVGGTGRSVFAYTSEIDAWLRHAKAPEPPPAAPEAKPATAPFRPPLSIAIGAALMVLLVGLVARSRPHGPVDLRVVVTEGGVIARDAAGDEQWRYPFPSTHSTVVPGDATLVTGGANPGVYVLTAYRRRQVEDRIESGSLTLLDLQGRLQRSFSFDDEVTFQGKKYGQPWGAMSFAVDEGTPPRVAVAAHHYTWDPGIVTVLDDRWQRRGTFVHAGWVEVVRWVARDRLLIGGFSNAHDGGMVALLDANALDGQGPEPPGTRHHCESCGSDRPLRMFVFPRSELNRASGSPFNRVLVVTSPGLVSVRTIEMPAARGDADAHYEFTPALDFVSARFSERYWDQHRVLEAEGKLTHTRADCPDRDGPRLVRMWTPNLGWQTLPVP